MSQKKPHTREFLEAALMRARELLNPRDFAIIFQAARASAAGKISGIKRKERKLTATENHLLNKTPLADMSKSDLEDIYRSLQFTDNTDLSSQVKSELSKSYLEGPTDSKLVFISTFPNELEISRKQAIVGDDAVIFNEVYLSPLNLKKSDITAGFIMPVPKDDHNTDDCKQWIPNLVKSLEKYKHAKIVALGKSARELLKEANIECWSLPHPSAVRKKGDSGEIARKLKSISKTLDENQKQEQNSVQQTIDPSNGDKSASLADTISKMKEAGYTKCDIIKSADDKQIVYGVVLDPYQVDLQNDWVPPAEIESTAHGFLKQSRIIGFEHMTKADAQIVESWVEPYPSPEDYKAALDNRPHKAFKRRFGNDTIHSGAWVAGVQVSEKEWKLYKSGKLNAFSVGGFSLKSNITTAEMPQVEFIELVQSKGAK